MTRTQARPASLDEQRGDGDPWQAMGAIAKKNLDVPDEVRRLPLSTVHLARAGPLTIGRATLQPGFRWSMHARPATDTSSCQIHHLGLLLTGRFAAQMDDGEYTEFGPNDVMDVPPGHDAWVIGDETVVLLDFYGNLGQFGQRADAQRVVTTLLMTDIVDSTVTATRLGDATWKQVLTDHNRVIRAQFDRFDGEEVNTTGDGFLARFASAIGALRCAAAVRDAAPDLGIGVRVGVHTGEVELLPNDIGGITVHMAARIASLGGPSEVIVSATTRALVEGSGFRFADRGQHRLKGLDRSVEVFLLES